MQRGPIDTWLRIICGVLGSTLMLLGAVGFRGGGRAALGGLAPLALGLLLLIPALGTGPGTDLGANRVRYRWARRLAWLGLGLGFFGLASLRAFDDGLRFSGSSVQVLQVIFSIAWVAGLIATFFTVYYSDQALRIVEQSDPRGGSTSEDFRREASVLVGRRLAELLDQSDEALRDLPEHSSEKLKITGLEAQCIIWHRIREDGSHWVYVEVWETELWNGLAAAEGVALSHGLRRPLTREELCEDL